MAPLERRPRHLRFPLARAPCAQPCDDPLREAQRPVTVLLVEIGDELAEAEVVLPQPADLAVERLSEPRQFLVGGQEPVAHHARGRDREIDRPDQALVQLRLLLGQLIGRGGGEGDEVDVAEQREDRTDDTAPQRGEVVALIQHQGRDPTPPQGLHPLARTRRQRLGEVDAPVLAAGDLALQRRLDASDLPHPAPRRCVPPGRGLPLHLSDRDAKCPGTVGDPPSLGDVPKDDPRVLDLAERLVGEARDLGVRVRSRDTVAGAEQLGRPGPLRLHGRVRAQHQRPRAQAADDLHAQHRLAGPRWSQEMRGAPAGPPVTLERLQRELLVAPPPPPERQ
jgi:hypothetical protein